MSEIGDVTQAYNSFLVALGVFGLGGTIFAGLVARTMRSAAVAGCCVLTGLWLVIGSADPKEPKLGEFFLTTLAVAIAGAAAAMLFRWMLWRPSGKDFLANFGSGIRRATLPGAWPSAAGKPRATTRELVQRWFVAVSAAAGGVVGALMTLPLFWESAAHAVSPRGLTSTIILGVISLVVVGPVHEFIVARGLSAPVGHDKQDERPLWERLTWSTVSRVLLVWAILIILELTYSSLDYCVKEGRLDTAMLILFNFLTPAIVSFYWTAALQQQSSIAVRCAGLASTVAAGCVYYLVGLGLSFVVVYWGFGAMGIVMESLGLLATLGFAVLLSVPLTLIFAFLICGMYGVAGSLAIERAAPHRRMFWLCAALFVPTAVQQALSIAVLVEFDVEQTWSDYFFMFPSTIGWCVGLVLSEFYRLLPYPEAADAPAKVSMAS